MSWLVPLPTEVHATRLGEALALLVRPGDCLCLSGDLGAGKTTLARALIRAFADDVALEVPSPTYTLVQPYEGAAFRFPLIHTDLYRLKDPDEVLELGLEEAILTGALIVEWPEMAAGELPGARIDIALTMQDGVRQAAISGGDAATNARIARAQALAAFIDSTVYAGASRRFLNGDASPRTYERLSAPAGNAILLNARAQPDRSPLPERLAYMKATHLAANDDIRPIIAIGAEFAARGFSVPAIHAHDTAHAVLVCEDLGHEFAQVEGAPVPERYEAAIDVLAAMHGQAWPDVARSHSGISHTMPYYDRTALEIEVSLCTGKYLPLASGNPADDDCVAAFKAAWDAPFALLEAAPRTWTIFDYHSPNILWLPQRTGIARIGIIDYQDARLGPAAYDVVSLTQDARVTVSPALEAALLARYIAGRKGPDAAFDEAAFASQYAICGAQRATRILGVFARLYMQDGKPHYLRHIPRIHDYLERNLHHPTLEALKAWFATHAPRELLGGISDKAGS